MKLANKPINSCIAQYDRDGEGVYFGREPGMTLLEYYAGLAMQALLSAETQQFQINESETARWAVKHAKALIAALEAEARGGAK